MQQYKQRESGIELLKIIAMFLIVLSHVTQTLYSENPYFMNDYVFPVKYATTNIQKLFLAWLMVSGAQGNGIFFICSAWFLLDINAINTKKIMYMLSDVWIVNVIILSIFKIGGWFDISIRDTISCFFPSIFSLNWYITCYILLYLVHLAINQIVKSRTQKQLLSINMVSLTLYCGINYLSEGHFFVSLLIEFIVIYIAVAYIKMYMPNYCNSKKQNLITLTVGISGIPLLILLTNYLGLHIPFFQDKLAEWGGNNSPFLLLVSISLLNLFRSRKFVSKPINYISSLALLIYIIHENLLIRTYIRPCLWIYIHENFGYAYVVLWDLLLAVLVFIIAMLIAVIYKNTLQKIVYKVTEKLHDKLSCLFEKLVCVLLKMN